ncbi:hypothetical protein [Streptomyces sediminimaris]|uniref:hypothetical protein n=1 Tax=Streptomyces sediminimaris TaxID=3383721 RepID=UPI0039999807
MTTAALPPAGTAHRCAPPAGVRTRAVLLLLRGTEPPLTLCRRLRVCPDCLDGWCATFLAYGVRALARGAGERGAGERGAGERGGGERGGATVGAGAVGGAATAGVVAADRGRADGGMADRGVTGGGVADGGTADRGVTGRGVADVLAEDVAELRRVLREAREEWALWKRLATVCERRAR